MGDLLHDVMQRKYERLEADALRWKRERDEAQTELSRLRSEVERLKAYVAFKSAPLDVNAEVRAFLGARDFLNGLGGEA